MTKTEIVEITDLLESGGFEVQDLQCGQFAYAGPCPSFVVRFQRKADLEKERAKEEIVLAERPDDRTAKS